VKLTDAVTDTLDEFDARYLMEMQRSDSQVFENVINGIYSMLVKQGDNCLDGGANKGLHTLPLARLVGREGMVLAVEPVPELARTLRSLVAERNLGQVQVLEGALYHEQRRVEFNVVSSAPSQSCIARDNDRAGVGRETIEVETVLIDDLLADAHAWRFGKLNLEDGEFRALQGGESAIARHRPFLVFERSVGAPGWYGYSVADFFDFFEDLNYEVYDLFAAPLSPGDWSAPDRPWYALAFSAGSKDGDFVRRRLAAVLRSVVEADRSPIDSVPADSGQAGIWAVPNPVPAGDGSGTTTVYWNTGDDSVGEVYISVNSDEERLFYRSAKGSRRAPWINAWGSYEFRLYRGVAREKLVSTVSVTRRKTAAEAGRASGARS